MWVEKFYLFTKRELLVDGRGEASSVASSYEAKGETSGKQPRGADEDKWTSSSSSSSSKQRFLMASAEESAWAQIMPLQQPGGGANPVWSSPPRSSIERDQASHAQPASGRTMADGPAGGWAGTGAHASSNGHFLSSQQAVQALQVQRGGAAMEVDAGASGASHSRWVSFVSRIVVRPRRSPPLFVWVSFHQRHGGEDAP